MKSSRNRSSPIPVEVTGEDKIVLTPKHYAMKSPHKEDGGKLRENLLYQPVNVWVDSPGCANEG